MSVLKNILFDLDGTLTDPKTGITKSVAYALERYGIKVGCLDDLNCFIGPPLYDSFVEYYGFSNEQAAKAVSYYREYFSDIGIFENNVYDGVGEMLEMLTKNGKRLILATSKPTVFAKRILEHFSLSQYFDFVAGSELDGRRTLKREVIEYAVSHCGITDAGSCIMAGDRKHDIIGAADAGMRSVGVLYGYGDINELRDAGATFIAESVDRLSELLISL